MKKPLITALLFWAILALPTHADDHLVPMWRIDGEANSIYLLGSVHMLRSSDYPLPAPIYDAYEAADTLIMELDMDDMNPAGMQALVLELGMLRDGRSLQELLGPADFERATQLANKLEVPIAIMGAVKPWFAAMTVEVLVMSRLGFDPSQGVEMHLTNMAGQDGKEILGLETERQQFEMLDGLSDAAQKDMFMQTLEDAGKMGEILDDLIAAWRRGDSSHMEEALLTDMRDYRELYNAILLNRNRDWVGQILPLLKEEDDYLIVVGALHLVGPDGVPTLLEERGASIRQVERD